MKNTQEIEQSKQLFTKEKAALLQCMELDSTAFQFASKELQNDKEIVLQAVKTDGSALQYASQRLKADKEVVLQHLRGHRCSMQVKNL